MSVRHRLPAVHLAPVGNAGDDHQAPALVDGVHDPVVPDPVIVATGELDASSRPRIVGQALDRDRDAAAQRVVEAPIRTRRLGVEADLVAALGSRGYVRTSDQGTADARSSRARRAARLSSR